MNIESLFSSLPDNPMADLCLLTGPLCQLGLSNTVFTITKRQSQNTQFEMSANPTLSGLTSVEMKVNYELKGSKVKKIVTAIKVPTAADSLNKLISAVANMAGPAADVLAALHFVEIGVTSIPSTGPPDNFAWAGLPLPPLGYPSGTCFLATVSAPPETSNDGTMANMMQSLMGSATATLVGCYAKGSFRMQIILDGTIILKDATSSNPNKALLSNFNLQVGFAPTAYVGFGTSLTLVTDQDGLISTVNDQSELIFDGSIQAVATTPPTMKFQLQMMGLWRNAFGNRHFAIGNLGLGASLTAVPPYMTSFALNGEVVIGKESVVNDCMEIQSSKWVYKTSSDPSKCFRGAGGFQVDILMPVNNYFYISISELTLQTIMGVFLGINLDGWPTCVKDSGFKDRDGDGEALHVSFAPGRDFVKSSGGDLVTLDQGIRFKGEFNILGWGATADVIIDLRKIQVKISTDPLNLGGVIEIFKDSDKTAGPYFEFAAELGRTPKANLEFSGYGSLLGFLTAEVAFSASNTHLSMQMSKQFAGTDTTFLISGALAASTNNYGFNVEFDWSFELTKMIQAIKDFMNVADKAMGAAQDAVNDASDKVQGAKKDTCEAIGKVCKDVKGSCSLSFLGWFGKALCSAWNWIVDAVCAGICAAASAVLDVVSAVLKFAAAVISVARKVMAGIVNFMAKVLNSFAPVKVFGVHFEGAADFSLRRQSSVAVDVTITVRNYYESLKCAPLFRESCLTAPGVWFAPWTFGFNFDCKCHGVDVLYYRHNRLSLILYILHTPFLPFCFCLCFCLCLIHIHIHDTHHMQLRPSLDLLAVWLKH